MLAHAVLGHADTDPERIAVVDARGTTTYGDLAGAVRRAAGWLATTLPAGATVGIWIGNRWEHLVVMLAAPLAGMVAVPMDPTWTGAEARTCLVRFNIAGLVVEDAEHLDRLAGADPNGEVVAALGEAVLTVEPGPRTLAEVVADHPAVPVGAGRADPDGVVCVSLTSGTTGEPKAIVLTERVMAARLVAQYTAFGFSSADRYLAATPLHYGGGRSYPLAHLVAGGTVELVPRWDTGVVLRRLTSGEIDNCFLVPTQLRRLAARLTETGARDGLAAPLRVLISSGSSLDNQTRTAVLAKLTPNLYEVYGGTEPGTMAIVSPGLRRARPGITAGVPVWNTEIRVVTPDGAVAPSGRPGEILVRSDAVFPGYLGDQAATQAAFAERWYRTGDVGVLDDAGHVHLKGRLKEMVITGGRNVFPGEVEAVVRAHPYVADVAVAGVPDDEWGEIVTAYVVPRAGTAPSVEDIQAFCQSRLAKYKTPRRMELVDEIPRNRGGKVDRKALVADAARRV